MVDKSLKLYNGSDLLPVNDYTDEDWTDWSQTELAMAADGGDSTASTWQLRDEGGVIPDRSGLSGSYYLEAHNVVKLTVGSNTLFNGRLGYDDRKQGRVPSAGVDTHSNKGRAVEFTVTLGDANEHLRGIVVHAWSRPEETDAARVQALVAAYLSGSPRPSTNLNGSNFVITGSNTFTVPAKTYYGVTPGEVLQELAELSDKQMFVDVDDNLHYHGNDYAWNAPIRISDDPADLDAVTCVPIDASRADEARDTLTALRVYWGNTTSGEQNTFLRTDTTKMEVNDYWEDVYFDSESTTWAEASNRASNQFVPRKLDQTSYTVTIGKPGSKNGEPWTSAEIALAPKAGQLIDFKALKARGGRASNGNWLGDTFLNRRIKEVRWTFPTADGFYCQLILDRPRHSLLGGTPFHKPSPPDTGTPGTPPTSPTDDVRWSFTDRGGAQTDNLYEDGGTSYKFDGAGWNANGAGVGVYFASDAMWWGSSGASTNTAIPITAGTDYTFGFKVMQQQTNSGGTFIIKWYSTGALSSLISSETLLNGFPYHAPTSYTYVRTAPVGANYVRIYVDALTGKQASADDIYIAHGGSGGTAGTPSTAPITTVGGTGSGSYTDSGEYVPVGSVLEHAYITDGGPYHDADQIAIDDVGGYYTGTEVEAALQEIGAALGVTQEDDTAATVGDFIAGTLSNPPTQAEVETVIGSPGQVARGTVYGLQDSGTAKRYLAISDGVQWHVVPLVVPLENTGTSALTSAPAGGWAQTHAVAYYNGVTYFAYVRGDNGNIEARTYTHSTQTVSSATVLHAALLADTHSSPSIVVSQVDHKIHAFYSDHAGAAMYEWISTSAEDISAGTESNIDSQLGGSGYTYPMVADLDSGLYLFIRPYGGAAASQKWSYAVSTVNGTWSTLTDFFTVSGRTAYPYLQKTGSDRVDFMAIDGSSLEGDDSILFFSWNAATDVWTAADGTILTLPIGAQSEIMVWDGSTLDDARGRFDVARGVDGHPRVLFASLNGATETYRHARWDGSAWVFTALLATTEPVSDDASFDSLDTNVVYLVDGSNEIRRLTTLDEVTWSSTTLTSGTTSLYPISALNHPPDLPVLWLTGSFTDAATYSLGVTGYGVSATTADEDNLQRIVVLDDTDLGEVILQRTAAGTWQASLDGGGSWDDLGGSATVDEATIRDIGHWEVIVDGSAPPVAVTNEAEDDWVYGWVSG